jgi:hypothetical protein
MIVNNKSTRVVVEPILSSLTPFSVATIRRVMGGDKSSKNRKEKKWVFDMQTHPENLE